MLIVRSTKTAIGYTYIYRVPQFRWESQQIYIYINYGTKKVLYRKFPTQKLKGLRLFKNYKKHNFQAEILRQDY